MSAANWSWDNRYLLLSGHLQNGSDGLLRISVADGQVRELLNLKTTATLATPGGVPATFSPDGRFVAYQPPLTIASDDVARIFVMPVQGKEPQLVYKEQQLRASAFESCRLLDWTADGRFLAIASERTGKGALYLLPIKDGRSAGAPVFVKYGDFEVGVTTASGALIYQAVRPGGMWAVYLASLDANGRPGDWKRPYLQLGNTLNPGAKWSDYGNEVMYVAMNGDAGQVGGRAVHVYNLATEEDREVYHASGMVYCAWAAQQPKLFCTVAGKKTDVSIGVDSGEIDRLYTFPTPQLLSVLRPSRDGRGLYLYEYVSGGEKLVQWEIGTGKETTLELFEPPPFSSWGNVSADERWVIRATKQDLAIRPVSGGDWKSLIPLKNYAHYSLTPNSKWLLYRDVDSAGKHGLFRIATAGGAPERLGDFPTSIWTGNIEITPDGRKIMVSAGDYETGYELWSLENFVPPTPKR